MWHLIPKNLKKPLLVGCNSMWHCFHCLVIRYNKWRSSYGHKCFMINKKKLWYFEYMYIPLKPYLTFSRKEHSYIEQLSDSFFDKLLWCAPQPSKFLRDIVNLNTIATLDFGGFLNPNSLLINHKLFPNSLLINCKLLESMQWP